MSLAISSNMKRIWVIGITLFLLLAIAVPAMAKPDTKVLNTAMRGEQEAPVTGDPDGKGKARIRLDFENSEVCWNLRVKDIVEATAAHIHLAPRGVPGPVVVPLSPPTGGRSSGCAAADPELIMAIAENPENYYVNVHNSEFPGGAVRGQLGK